MVARTSIVTLPSQLIKTICYFLVVRHEELSFLFTVDYKSLLQLATTCRYLHGPAMDALWQTLENLVPMIYTLPRDLFVVGPRDTPTARPGRIQSSGKPRRVVRY